MIIIRNSWLEQRQFNSQAQKARRAKFDMQTGLNQKLAEQSGAAQTYAKAAASPLVKGGSQAPSLLSNTGVGLADKQESLQFVGRKINRAGMVNPPKAQIKNPITTPQPTAPTPPPASPPPVTTPPPTTPPPGTPPPSTSEGVKNVAEKATTTAEKTVENGVKKPGFFNKAGEFFGKHKFGTSALGATALLGTGLLISV